MHLLSVHQIFLVYYILQNCVVFGDDNERSSTAVKLIKGDDDYSPNSDFNSKLEKLPEFVKNINRFDDPDEHWETFRYIKHFKKHKKSFKSHHGRTSPTITINGHRYVRVPKKLRRPKKYYRKYRKYTSLPPYYKRHVRSHGLKDDLINEPSNHNVRYIGEATLPMYSPQKTKKEIKQKTKPQTNNKYEDDDVPSLKLPTTYLYPKYPETYSGYNMEQQNLNKYFKDASKWFESELEDVMNDHSQESPSTSSVMQSSSSLPSLSSLSFTPSSSSSQSVSSQSSASPSFLSSSFSSSSTSSLPQATSYQQSSSFIPLPTFTSTLSLPTSSTSLFTPSNSFSSSIYNNTSSSSSTTSSPLVSSKSLPSMLPLTYIPPSSTLQSSSSLSQYSSFTPFSYSTSLPELRYPDSDKAYSNTYFKPLSNLWKAIDPRTSPKPTSKNQQNDYSLNKFKNGATMSTVSSTFTPTEIVMPSLF